jgi:putative transposase
VKPLFSSNLQNIINKYTVPNHVVDNAINDVIKAYKTSYSLQKKGIIKCFKVRYKKFSKDNQTIVIEKEDFSKVKNGFYISYLGEIDCNYNLKRSNILCNTRLTYKKLTNTFILNVPTYVNKYEIEPTNRICSIDPGYKTFLTVYNPNGHCLKIFNRKNTIMLTQLLKKRISARKIIDEQYFNHNMVMRNPSQYKKIKMYYKRISIRIQNLVKELHYKSAHMLCQFFDKILLGKLSTKGITSKVNKMPTFEKHYAYMISHYKFSNILIEVAEKYNTEVKVVCESYTSKTCGGCGYIQNISNLDIYDCKQCNMRIDRDLNGARNILIKNVN